MNPTDSDSAPGFRVELLEVTESNWQEALSLSVRPDQKDFVPSVAVSLAKAYIKPGGMQADPFAIYIRPANDAPVGFLLFLHDLNEPVRGYLDGFLIAEQFQKRGYGRASVSAFLSLVRTRYQTCREVCLFVAPDNEAARALYEGQGFRRIGWSSSGRIAYLLTLDAVEG